MEIIDPGSEIHRQIDILYAHPCTYDTPVVALMNMRLFLHSGVPWITAIAALIIAQVVGLLQKRTPILWPLTLWHRSRGGAVVWCCVVPGYSALRRWGTGDGCKSRLGGKMTLYVWLRVCECEGGCVSAREGMDYPIMKVGNGSSLSCNAHLLFLLFLLPEKQLRHSVRWVI